MALFLTASAIKKGTQLPEFPLSINQLSNKCYVYSCGTIGTMGTSEIAEHWSLKPNPSILQSLFGSYQVKVKGKFIADGFIAQVVEEGLGAVAYIIFTAVDRKGSLVNVLFS